MGARRVLLVLMAIGFLLRWERIQEPIRMDEAANAVYYADRTWGHALYSSGGNENHVLNSLLTKVSFRLAGFGEVSSRAPALIAGLALIPAVWWLGMAAGAGEAASLAAAAVVTASPWMIFFSTNGRGYIYQAVCLCLLLGATLRYRSGARFSRAIVPALIAAVMGTLAARSFAVYTAGMALACAWLALRNAHGERTRMLRFATCLAAGYGLSILLFYLPNLIRSGLSATMRTPRYLDFSPEVAPAKTLWNHASAFGAIAWPVNEYVAVAIAGALIAAVIVSGRAFPLGTFVAAFAIAWMVVALGSRHIVMVRVMLPSTVAAAVWMGVAAASLIRFRGAPAWAPALAVAALIAAADRAGGGFERIHDTGHLPHARETARELLRLAPEPSRALIDLPGFIDAPIAFYFREAGRGLTQFITLGVNRKTDLCAFDSAIAWRKGTRDPGAAIADASPQWRQRAARGEIVSRAGGGQIVRYALKACSAPR